MSKATIEYIRQQVSIAEASLTSYLYQPPETRDAYFNRAKTTLEELKKYLTKTYNELPDQWDHGN